MKQWGAIRANKNLRRCAARASNNTRWTSGEPCWHPGFSPPPAGTMRVILRRKAARHWLPAVAAFLICHNGNAQLSVDASDVTPSQMQTGTLLLKMKSGYAVATRLNTDITAQASGLAARVTVSQEFRNSGTEWVEGVYVYPLPDAAAVDRFRMHIGERFIEGEIREKEQAKKEYEEARAAGKKASLVQQERANLFTTSVANIAPGETVRIEIEYQETLRIDEGTFSLRIPVTVTPRYIPGTPLPGRRGSGWSRDTSSVLDASRITPPVVTRSTTHKLSFTAELNAGMPLEFVASRYHPVDITNNNERYSIRLTNTHVPMDHDLELTWKPVPDTVPRAMLFTESVQGDAYALLMMLPPADSASGQVPQPRELVLTIDTSGSMHGTSLDQAKRALTLALDGLRPDDLFNVIQFNSITSALHRDSVPGSVANVAAAKRFVNSLSANGGTEMRTALQQALQSPANESHLRQIIFVTDGSVGNEESLFQLIENQLGNTRLFTVGIGSAPNSWFMRKAAEAGRGTFTTISSLHEVSEKMERLFRKIEQPQITDITIQWPDGLLADAYPATVPDLYAGEPIFVRARLGGQPRDTDIVSIRGTSSSGTWGEELPLRMNEPASGVATLWARARIEALMDGLRRGADEVTTREDVVQTAIAHHIVSKYTSLVAVDKTPVRPADTALNSEQVPNLLPYGQSTEAIFGFPATATGWSANLLNGLLLILVALLALTMLRRGTAHAWYAAS